MGILLSLPTSASSLLLVYVCGVGFGLWAALVVVAVWVLFTCAVFSALWLHPNRGKAAAAYGFRRPVGSEPELLASAWSDVTRTAAVDGWPYSLWVQEASSLNAYAAPARIVAVTSWAISVLKPRELAAVLAHELGHQLMTDPRLRLLDDCCALPVRMVRGIAGALAGLVRGHGSVPTLLRMAAAVSLPIAGAIALVPLIGIPTATLLVVVLGIEPFTSAARSRRAELAADRVAVDLGYGRALHSALRRQARYDPPPPTGLLAAYTRWVGTHPSTTLRLQAIRRAARP
ncbi:M48 family metalloprotease [Nocardia mangyaensis]|uniref:M48 family metalloprotease n=1 Tax=Nocardia mangyaensis TaxID=2213200 RepID=UPI002674E0AD|nr:M48 family metalloprotease [Nocardia mangyaensis]MDO3646280.1 M48 family metalloprotease [Nocardia mangyaensis]